MDSHSIVNYLQDFDEYAAGVLYKDWPCGQNKTEFQHSGCTVCRDRDNRTDHQHQSSCFVPVPDAPIIEVRQADRWKLEYEPNHVQFRAMIASTFTAKSTLVDFVKRFPYENSCFEDYQSLTEALWASPQVRRLDQVLIDSNNIFEHFLRKDPNYTEDMLADLPLETSAPNFEKPTNEFHYQCANWFENTIPEFTAYLAEINGGQFMTQPVPYFSTDARIVKKIAESSMARILSWVPDPILAKLYVFSPTHYLWNHHNICGNAWGFGWTNTIAKADQGDVRISKIGAAGTIDIEYYCRRRRDVATHRRIDNVPYLGAIGDLIPETRCGFYPSSKWDKPDVAKLRKFSDGTASKGGKWIKQWAYRTGVIYTIKATTLVPVTIPVNPNVIRRRVVNPIEYHHCMEPLVASYRNAMGIPHQTGDEIIHWAINVAHGGASLRLVSANHCSERHTTGYDHRGSEQWYAGWAIFRDRTLVNPFCYAQSKPMAIVDCHVDSAHALSIFGGIEYVVPTRCTADDFGYWQFPCSPFWIHFNGIMFSPILRSGCVATDLTDFTKIMSPRIGTMSWFSFANAAKLGHFFPFA